jgi:Raf kinase inhibitor-like YbhB/YbcL family protein
MRVFAGSMVLFSTAIAVAAPATLTVSSPAFTSGGAIPVQFTCDGAARAPTLTWSGVPAGTQSVAVLVDEPDAKDGPFVHLLVTDLPPNQTSVDLGAVLPVTASVTHNDSGTVGYLAPCPEDGQHTYHYRVYALDEKVRRAPATRVVTRASFLRGIAGHVLAEGELVGTYERH